MKIIIILATIVVFIMTTSHLIMVETSPLLMDNNLTKESLKQLTHRILSDQAFFALNPRQKVHVLIVILNIIERRFNKI